MNNEMPGPHSIYEVMVMEPRSLKKCLSDSSIARAQVGGAKPDDDGSGSGTAGSGFCWWYLRMDGHQERIGEYSFTPICPSHYQLGVVHEVPQTPVRTQRITAPTQLGHRNRRGFSQVKVGSRE